MKNLMLSLSVCILFSLHGMEQPEPQNTNERTYKLPAAKELEKELRALGFHHFMQETNIVKDLADKELTREQIFSLTEKSWSAYPLNNHPKMKNLMDISKKTLMNFFKKKIIQTQLMMAKQKILIKLSETKMDPWSSSGGLTLQWDEVQ